MDKHFLELLAKTYPTDDAVSAEIINLKAICHLPKGTEYFFSDIHGEADAFSYLLRTASGVVRSKIENLFQNSVPEPERDQLSALVYRPKTVLRAKGLRYEDEWLRITIYRLVQICRSASGKYTRSKVRKKMPPQFDYILDELLHADTEENKEEYYTSIIAAIVEAGIAERFITILCQLIRQCSIDSLHIIGDIYDRGPHADIVIEEMMQCDDVDIQWGNHDIHWMGAAMGNEACVANVVRLAISYNNFDLLEDSYAIILRPLATFAAKVYGEDPCASFRTRQLDQNVYNPIDEDLAAKMHKAIAIIQFKLEGQLIARHPEYEMQNRSLLEKIDFEKGETELDGTRYPLRDTLFPTIDPEDPLALSEPEQELIHTLTRSFTNSILLSKHVRFLFNNGSMYKVVNGNLLFHGCVPMCEDGTFTRVSLDGKRYSGKAYLDAIDKKIRKSYYSGPGTKEAKDCGDYLWYLWCGKYSPLFGKSCITTFERYFVEDKACHVEIYDPYYDLTEIQEECEKVLKEFGLDPDTGHIINGHVPVRQVDGESPIRAGGRLFVIDGGLSKAYQSKTGIGGYTLISNSHELALAEHRPYEELRAKGFRVAPKVKSVERYAKRVTVQHTDTGELLTRRIEELQALQQAYRKGILRENSQK